MHAISDVNKPDINQFQPSARPAKSGGSWDPRSKKIFRLQENFQPKSRTFVKDHVFVANPALSELLGKNYTKISLKGF